jgi:hypothetical protein
MKCISKGCDGVSVPDGVAYPSRVAGMWRAMQPFTCKRCSERWAESIGESTKEEHRKWKAEQEKKHKFLFNKKYSHVREQNAN